jgi:hypothetical protein
MALWLVAFLGSRPLFALLDGALAQAWGVRVASGGLLFTLVITAAIAWRATRTSRRSGAMPAIVAAASEEVP